MANNKLYMIVGHCNPYHSKLYCREHHRVLKYGNGGTTPIKWVVDDNYGLGFTDKEVEEKMREMVSGEAFFYDRNMIEEYRNDDYDNEGYDDSWFEGDGYYDENHYPLYILNSGIIRDDVMVYTIEEYSPKMYRVVFEQSDDIIYAKTNEEAIDKAKSMVTNEDNPIVEITLVDEALESLPSIQIIYF